MLFGLLFLSLNNLKDLNIRKPKAVKNIFIKIELYFGSLS